MESVLTKKQVKTFKRAYVEDGREYVLIAKVRYDDECGNGHNTFSITGEIWRAKNGQPIGRDCESCGCIHDDIAKHLPELAPYIKWHLVSSDEPMHYIANTVYHAQKAANLDHARSTAAWPDATDEDLLAPGLEVRLQARLPRLMEEFRAAIEALGFVY